MGKKSLGVLVLGVILLLGLGLASSSLIESVQGGEVHVKQAAISGDLTVRATEGMYNQMFGKVTKYYRTAETYLSDEQLDGGSGAETNAIKVRFGDGGTADIGSVTQWRLPLTEEAMVKIHRNFRSMAALQAQVRQWVIEVEQQTASTFKADETYNARRAEFMELITSQIVNGIYATEKEEVLVPTNEVDASGKPVMSSTTNVRVKLDKDGQPIIIKPGIFQEYQIELVNHSIKSIKYDDTIEKLIAQKKEAEQAKAVAITNAEKALQDAITAEAKGKADIAEAKAREEVAKITAVTRAQKEKEVAELDAQRNKSVGVLNAERDLEVATLARQEAEEKAAADLALATAEAEANTLLVEAGLTPLLKAQIDRDTAIGVAREIAKIKLPVAMVIGGNDGGATVDPLTAVGINQMLNIVDQIGAKEAGSVASKGY